MASVILGLGHPFCDRTTHVSDDFLIEQQLEKGLTLPSADAKIVDDSWNNASRMTDAEWTLGGSCTNVIKTLALLKQTESNHRCALLGKIGSDPIGLCIERQLKDIGILSFLSKGNDRTGVVNCFITPDKQRTMHTYTGACREFSEDDIHPEEFDNVVHLHLCGYLPFAPEALKKSLKIAKEKQLPMSLDLASRNIVELFRSDFTTMIPDMSFVFGNKEEMHAFTGIENFQDAADAFRINQTIIATDGSEGCWVKHKNESDAVHFDALKVLEVVDTTGAGDFFAGGFLHGALNGDDVSQCVKKGNLAASYVIQEVGAELPSEKWSALRRQVLKV